MTVYLVRHAVAVGRSDWDRDDLERPLTKKGQRQARGLVDALVHADLRQVLSSPAVRCRDTVAPLAAKVGLPVDDAPWLAEGSDLDEAVERLRSIAESTGDGAVVACAHGDLIPEIVRRLARDGMVWDGDLRFAKGSTWALSFEGGRCTAGRYEPPPA